MKQHIVKTPENPTKFFFGLICILLGIITLCIVLFTAVNIQSAIAAQGGNNNKAVIGYDKTVIIDPGHGGIDGGAVGVDGVVEKGINLSISLKLESFFDEAGYQVIMTREDDRSIHNDGSNSVRQKKVSDIHNRFHIMEQYPNALFISIHQNKYDKSQYSGTQVFYSANNDNSKMLAQFIQSRVKSMLQPDNSREIKAAGDNLYLLYHAKSPAVLVECGFLSNPKEASLLQDPNYQNKMAFAIFCGTLDMFPLSTTKQDSENSE